MQNDVIIPGIMKEEGNTSKDMGMDELKRVEHITKSY